MCLSCLYTKTFQINGKYQSFSLIFLFTVYIQANLEDDIVKEALKTVSEAFHVFYFI